MLEKASDDAYDSDAIADSRNSRPEATDAADNQIDFHSSLRRVVEVLDEIRIDEGVHFRDDSARLPRPGVLRFPVHHLRETLTHVARRDEQIPECVLARESGQRIKEIGEIGAD